jgi:hypothetical protein
MVKGFLKVALKKRGGQTCRNGSTVHNMQMQDHRAPRILGTLGCACIGSFWYGTGGKAKMAGKPLKFTDARAGKER